jgi:glycosyltransferase involved in cell wall biosynthesis
LAAQAKIYEDQLKISCFDACMAYQPHLLSYTFPFLEAEVRQASAIVFAHPYWYPSYQAFIASLGLHPPAWAQKPLVYEAHNVEGRLKKAMYPDSLFGKQLANCVAATEAQLIDAAALLSACSQEDADHLAWMAYPEPRRSARPVVITPNGLDLQNVRYQSWRDRFLRAKSRGYCLALFMGSHHLPNLEAAALISQAAGLAPPNWKFVILGGCGHGLQDDEKLENLLCPGTVTEDEKQLWFDEATLGLNLMASGSGTNLKLAEYASWGLPVMATEVGVRGWQWEGGKQFLKCDFNAQSFLEGLERFEEFVAKSAHEDDAIRQQAELLNWRRIGGVFSQDIDKAIRLS